MEKFFGASIKRREDPRLITGKGTFVDDLRIPGTTTAAFVRSPHAHARIVRIDATAATKIKGVLAVYTGKDLVAAGAVHDDARDNVSFRWQLGDKAATDKAFAGAPRIVKQSFRNHRLIPNAIGPRAALASANPGTGEVTLWLTTQNPHVHRLLMA